MKFLCDQDVYAATVRFLRGLGHAVATAAELGLAQAPDYALLQEAHAQGQLLVTRDRDFGGLVFTQGAPAGVIYLRIAPSAESSVHAELRRLLEIYTVHELENAFVVVEPGRHRIRRLGSP